MKKKIGAVFGLTLCLLLTACNFPRNPTDPYLALRSVEGELEVTVCRDLLMSKVLLQQRAEGSVWVDVWEGEAVLILSAGETFTSAALPNETVLEEPAMSPGDDLDIVLISSTEGDLGVNATVSVPESGMPTDQWLMSDGTVRDDPCAAVEDLREQGIRILQ